ncbi:MAG: hypothetical protein OWT27_08140 [Firmicutes bacterium]|nr:hypothetical protein [Bacillota bacterium]
MSFRYDERLQMPVPALERDLYDYGEAERSEILVEWERIRGNIPAIISRFEEVIVATQDELHHTEDWEDTVRLMEKINDYASRIADLNILFRTEPEFHPPQSHS